MAPGISSLSTASATNAADADREAQVHSELEKELEAQTGMSRWWEENELGYMYFVRCPCGLVFDAVARTDVQSQEFKRYAETRALNRFRVQYPECPHVKPYEKLRSDPEFIMQMALRAFSSAFDVNALWAG